MAHYAICVFWGIVVSYVAAELPLGRVLFLGGSNVKIS